MFRQIFITDITTVSVVIDFKTSDRLEPEYQPKPNRNFYLKVEPEPKIIQKLASKAHF